MKDKLTLKMESSKVASLVLGSSSPLTISIPAAGGGTSKASVVVDTTESWSHKPEYVPARGEIVVYADRNVIDGVNYPGVKIGDGVTHVANLPFVGDDIAEEITDALTAHVDNENIHVTSEEKERWDNGSFPSGGLTGDLLVKRTDANYDTEWITPANSPEEDNTRPITAAAVYTTVGNINALLATI